MHIIQQGYDAIFIASTLGLDTLGVDLSTTAIQSAHRYYFSPIKRKTEFTPGSSLLASSPDVFPRKVTFQEVDFFSLSVPEEEKFDLVYDYTYVEIHCDSVNKMIDEECLKVFLWQFLHRSGRNGQAR